ncbi:lytic transglycosylase domain-containing protein [Brevundimonas sp. SL130]|uniref:lytic transglycosylase domain-containing protein n=1 Tax=Brevundimonas sp. SL130 TaxID=2995143 RepID=UPI00226CE9A6|nr:transglycosylase SLT domain-containing protein [Brevundimonas sp. SL130]WAC61389.1 transglycosylase SLT domain-containing protein [Brevundimonas sp. SL130]
MRGATGAAVLLGLISLAAGAGPARAQVVDWSAAGGGLFGVAPGDGDAVNGFEGHGDRIAALSQPYQAAVEAAARRHGLDEKLLHAVVIVESAYRPEACSIAGACGLTQLMPGTAADLQVRDRLAPEENLRGGAAYLAQQLVRFGDVRLALAA